MDSHLLAVAVHDRQELRLEPVGIDRVEAAEGDTPVFRVSYRLADRGAGREDARLTASFRIDGGPWEVQQVEMHDRPLRSDAQGGSLQFHVGPLAPGDHLIEYRLEAQSSDRTMLSRDDRRHAATLAGRLTLHVSRLR